MEVTFAEQYTIGREILEQMGSDSPIPSMGGIRISEMEQAELVAMCRTLASRILFCVDAMLEEE